MPLRVSHVRTSFRYLAATAFIGAGIMHLTKPEFFRRIIPPQFPSPGALVLISGLCEIAGGAGLLIRPLRRSAGWGLIALLIAVFPANIYMVVNPEGTAPDLPRWTLWARLPFQAVFIVWVYLIALRHETPTAQKSEQ